MKNRQLQLAGKKKAPNKIGKQKITSGTDRIRDIYHKLRWKLTITEVNEITEQFKRTIQNPLKKGNKVSIHNFLNFEVGKIAPRQMKCMLDGKTCDIPERKVVNVRVGEGGLRNL